ncbi:hypothetical protein CDAR_299621 [Caerostris darwini]|uniref:Uncharacterized protein n=1 Tax=Caerostris darwini TaxID=1538125 RepID=A0AAV4RNW7_9ARAC|nr:hypothetical protein CDAR_299621 [Caerostris darwini]
MSTANVSLYEPLRRRSTRCATPELNSKVRHPPLLRNSFRRVTTKGRGDSDSDSYCFENTAINKPSSDLRQDTFLFYALMNTPSTRRGDVFFVCIFINS